MQAKTYESLLKITVRLLYGSYHSILILKTAIDYLNQRPFRYG